MSKYEPLRRHLQASGEKLLEFSFADIEAILGFPLPASARRYAAWWSNSEASHVQAQAWLSANFETKDVDMTGQKLRFVSTGPSRGFGETEQPAISGAPAEQGTSPKRHPIFGSLKGTTIVMPDVDLTAPADPDWGKVYDQDYDHGVVAELQRTQRK